MRGPQRCPTGRGDREDEEGDEVGGGTGGAWRIDQDRGAVPRYIPVEDPRLALTCHHATQDVRAHLGGQRGRRLGDGEIGANRTLEVLLDASRAIGGGGGRCSSRRRDEPSREERASSDQDYDRRAA